MVPVLASFLPLPQVLLQVGIIPPIRLSVNRLSRDIGAAQLGFKAHGLCYLTAPISSQKNRSRIKRENKGNQ
jgi:hypothetical protein